MYKLTKCINKSYGVSQYRLHPVVKDGWVNIDSRTNHWGNQISIGPLGYRLSIRLHSYGVRTTTRWNKTHFCKDQLSLRIRDISDIWVVLNSCVSSPSQKNSTLDFKLFFHTRLKISLLSYWMPDLQEVGIGKTSIFLHSLKRCGNHNLNFLARSKIPEVSVSHLQWSPLGVQHT